MSGEYEIDGKTARDIALSALLEAFRDCKRGCPEARRFLTGKRLKQYLDYMILDIDAGYIRRKLEK